MKVKQLQTGGYINYEPNPMVPQQSVQQPQQEAAQPAASQEAYLDKGILEKMLGKGITTDVIDYSQKLDEASNQYEKMSDAQRNTYRGKSLRSLLKGDLGQLNGLIRAKEMFDDSIKTAKENGALSEFAVTPHGMIVKNQAGNIEEMTFSDYAKQKDSGKITALTNGQLAEEREYNKQLMGKSSVFSILNYGKGIDKVQDEVLKIVGTIGRSSSSVSKGEYSGGVSADDMQQLQQAAKSGLFKVKAGESTESNSDQINMAKQAMWMTLSDNSKAVLRARAAEMGADPSKLDKVAQNLAASLLDPHTAISKSVTMDESYANAKAGKAGTGKDAPQADIGAHTMAFSGASNTIPLSSIGPEGVKIDGFASPLPTQDYSGKDGERVTLRNSAKLNNLAQLNKAFVANGDKVNPDTTVITGNAYISQPLPYTIDDKGNFKIDRDGAKKYAIYQDVVSKLSKSDPNYHAKVAQLANEYHVNGIQVRKFIVAEATSYADEYWDSRDKNYYQKVTGAEKEAVGDIVDPNSESVKKHFDNDAHKHLIFIPSNDLSSYVEADGNHATVDKSTYALKNGFNTGNGGNYIDRGQSIMTTVTPQQMGLTADSFNNK